MRTVRTLRQNGATLIEVLITVVLLAVGLLGLASLQATSIKSNHSAYQRSQATILAYDLAERMRANRNQALAGSYDEASFPASSSTHTVSGSQTQKDTAEWLNKLAIALPDGTGRAESTGTLVTIYVQWTDNRGRIKAMDDVTTLSETFVYRTEI